MAALALSFLYSNKIKQLEDELNSEKSKSNGYQRELREYERIVPELEAELINEKSKSSECQGRVLQLEAELNSEKSKSNGYQRELREYERRVPELETELINEKLKRTTEVGQKAELKNHLKEIEEKLATTEARFKEENKKSRVPHKDLEREAALKHLSEELEVKKKEILLLENKVKDLEQKLQLPNAKSKKKDMGGATEPKGRRYKISGNRLFNFFKEKE